MEIGKRLKVLRKESGETQTQVAAAIGIVMRHYQRIENDEGLPAGPLPSQALRPLWRLPFDQAAASLRSTSRREWMPRRSAPPKPEPVPPMFYDFS